MGERSKKRWDRWSAVAREEKIALRHIDCNGPWSPNVCNDLKPMGWPTVITSGGL